MTESQIPRYALVQCEVTGHASYGLVLQVSGGVRGFVDKVDIADEAVAFEDWPHVGESLTCVVLGYSRDGRIRASARPRDIALVAAVSDPESALMAWVRIRDQGFADSRDRARFIESADAIPVIRWALRHRIGTADWNRASEILSDAPDRLKREVYR
ncbi:hypothetical protein TPA0908_13600 [Micromonospora sp. AKA38]|nr:hypothetical protein TPA0908_13600 [Micromonospora sp. AKA38]